MKQFAPLDSAQGRPVEQWIGSGFSITPDGGSAAFLASDASTLPELYVSALPSLKPRKLTDMTKQVSTWARGALEVVSWKSQDEATIEGVLHKPVGFQAGRKYPLLVVIHGGPTGVSRPALFSSTGTYPIDIWTAKGALVIAERFPKLVAARVVLRQAERHERVPIRRVPGLAQRGEDSRRILQPRANAGEEVRDHGRGFRIDRSFRTHGRE